MSNQSMGRLQLKALKIAQLLAELNVTIEPIWNEDGEKGFMLKCNDSDRVIFEREPFCFPVDYSDIERDSKSIILDDPL